ncbi:hypothetical protein GTW51_23345 [Aurantimonas aggregata]|uniref:Uncharacterized protein n=1 Tax=Aurantimonas aggregata TaxID=2047720 RepID=A0A6L9MPC6_9HYPH|nr:hypothetical protein [Aurantimonas aggregata]NDV89565.1 hypothetical protein [Aurantimonas aggregata]
MRLPKKPAWLGILTAFWLLTMPIAVGIYTYVSDLHGGLSYYGWQNTTLLMAILALFLSVPIGLIQVVCVRHYNSAPSLLAWRSDRHIASILATVACTAFVLGCLRLSMEGSGFADFLAVVWFAGWAAWAIVMRALFIDRAA